MDVFVRNWQKCHQSSLTFRIREIIVGKVKLKTKTISSNLLAPTPAEIVKHKQYHIPNRIEEISAILKD